MRFLLLFLLFLSACQSSEPKGEVFRLNLKDSGTSLDPRRGRDLGAVTFSHLLWEGLFRSGQDSQIELTENQKRELDLRMANFEVD